MILIPPFSLYPAPPMSATLPDDLADGLEPLASAMV
jgi:hypothetical protein